MIKNIKNRWLVVIGAIMIQLALGAIYAWSVFTKILTDSEGIYIFTAKETAWVFSAYVITGIVGPFIAGYFKDSAQIAGDQSVWMIPIYGCRDRLSNRFDN